MRSRRLAEAIKTWLSDTMHQLQPWMSSEDMAKGAGWSVDIFKELEGAHVGIICLTPENITAHWILFEAENYAQSARP